MSRGNYLKTKLPAVCASLFGMLFLTLFLLACGNSAASILFILTAWLIFFLCCEEISWRMRKKYLDSLLHMAEHLEEKYLIAEVMDVPKRADDRVFYELMKMAEKSMLETVGEECGRKKHSKAYGKTAWRMVRTPCLYGSFCFHRLSRLLYPVHFCGNFRLYWIWDIIKADFHNRRYSAPAAYLLLYEYLDSVFPLCGEVSYPLLSTIL